MRASRRHCSLRISAALFFAVSAAWASIANAQNQGSQVLKLPDPTPRELSPDLRYHIDSSTPAATKALQTAQNEKRWQLIVWAADELVVLSERAEKAVQAPPNDATTKELTRNVTKIETLSKNLAIALKAH